MARLLDMRGEKRAMGARVCPYLRRAYCVMRDAYCVPLRTCFVVGVVLTLLSGCGGMPSYWPSSPSGPGPEPNFTIPDPPSEEDLADGVSPSARKPRSPSDDTTNLLPIGPLDPAEEIPADLDSVERLIYTANYAGHLTIHFDETIRARMSSPASVRSLNDKENVLRPVATILAAAYPQAQLAPAVEGDPAEIDARRAELERLSGGEIKLADWNSIYHLNVTDHALAVKLMRELKDEPAVARIYPAMRGFPSGILDTPALDGLQTYLKDEANYGGLNASAAWNRGVKGNGVFLVDDEGGLNFDHEDLGLVAKRLGVGGNFVVQPDCAPGFPDEIPNCEMRIAHGTAVAGILVAKDNGHGVTGFAPESYLLGGEGGGRQYLW